MLQMMMLLTRREQSEAGEAGDWGQERRGGLQRVRDGPGDRAVLRGQGAYDLLSYIFLDNQSQKFIWLSFYMLNVERKC